MLADSASAAEHDVIGRIIRVDGEPHEIVGRAACVVQRLASLRSLRFLPPARFRPTKIRRPPQRPTLRPIGRRSAKLSHAESGGFIANFGARLAADFPEVNAGSTWRAISLNGTVLPKRARDGLAMLVGLSGFVLLIACSNLANLLLARTMARAREFAVRARWALRACNCCGRLIAESLLLAIAGGACAILVAGVGRRLALHSKARRQR